jgi:hypothetical protein
MAAGCAHVKPDNPNLVAMDGHVLTHEMILSYNVSTAWDVLKKTGAFRMSRDDGDGRPVEIRTRRGRNSISIRESGIPKVIFNGSPLWDVRYLKEIPAHTIDWIQLLNGIDGTTREGTNAGGGVIVIVSRSG